MANGKNSGHNTSPGPAVDASGQTVVDPTKNVDALVAAEGRRQDGLREAESRRVDEQMKLRAEYDEKLRNAEASRIDAIRAVDQGNVTRASEVAAAQATALAAQLQVSAEALRAQVEATRVTTADTLAAALSPIQNDVAVLREVQFRQQGEKTAGDDPVVKAIAELTAAQNRALGGEGANDKAGTAFIAATAAKASQRANYIAATSVGGVLLTIAIGIATHGKF